MKKLIFIYDRLLHPDWRSRLKLPLIFISFAFVKGKMFTYRDSKKVGSVFIVKPNSITQKHGNDLVYGALFLLDKSEHYLRTLDSMYVCSLARMFKNHDLDFMHRNEILATPIHFKTLESFHNLLYYEQTPVKCFAYYGNVKNSYIKHRVKGTRGNSNRIMHNIDYNNFIACYDEVAKGGEYSSKIRHQG